METNIIKIDGNKIQAIVDNDVKEYELADWVKPEYVKVGEAEITILDDKVTFVHMKTSQPFVKGKEEKATGDTSKSWEDEIVTFEQLLEAAHKKSNGNFSIKTWKLEVNLEKKYALFKARVIVYNHKARKEVSEKMTDEDEGFIVFEGHGDATDENVTGDFIKPHFIRMAETRAIVRALRWYTNNATCTEEEK